VSKKTLGYLSEPSIYEEVGSRIRTDDVPITNNHLKRAGMARAVRVITVGGQCPHLADTESEAISKAAFGAAD
jgi:hypothetical protein